MNLLQRYIFKRFFLNFLGTMLFLLFLFILVRTMEMIDVFLREADNTDWLTYVKYYVLEMPYTLNYLFPIGVLFSLVYTLGKMNSDRELTILFTSGKSIIHYTAPIIILISVLCTIFAINDYEIYYKSHQMHMEIHRKFSGKTFFGVENAVENESVQFGRKQKIYIISSFSPTEEKLEKTKIIFFNEKNNITNIYNVQEAKFLSNTQWKAKEVEIREFKEGAADQTYKKNPGELILDLGDEPKLFKPTPHDPIHLARKQVKEEAERLEISGGNTAKWWTEYHLKISSPYAALVMVFLGLSLSTFSRRSVLVLTFFWVLIISFLYMILINVGGSLGETGFLPPIIAGWFGNIFFSLVAFFLYRKLQN